MDKAPSLALDDVEGPVYDALGVDMNASKSEITDAYRRLAMIWHPDRHHGDEGAKIVFQEIVRAYQILTNPATREQHDLEFGCLDRIIYVQEYLLRYFYLLLSPQGLNLQVDEHMSCNQFTVELHERLASPIST